MIKAFVINLPEATDRLNATVNCLRAAQIDASIVDAIRGSDLVDPSGHFAETKYKLRQGRRRIDGEVGCYVSHIKALKHFLKPMRGTASSLRTTLRLAATFPM